MIVSYLIIIIACAMVVFGMLGWLFFDQQKGNGNMEQHFRDKFGKL